MEQAKKFSESSRQADGYNAAAFVNLGSCSMAESDFEKAKDLFLCALENDASCVEALYNLGAYVIMNIVSHFDLTAGLFPIHQINHVHRIGQQAAGVA